MTIDFDAVSKRNAHLETVRATLKTEFFGIDKQIDDVIESIKTWYLMPEIITRPTLVSLWSLTGNGKTSLIRALVKYLGLQTKFVEIQMDGFSNGDAGDDKSLCSILRESSIKEGEQGIILLDEFQRFRTIDAMGNDLKIERYNDVWTLLSDGQFPNDYSYLGRLEQRMDRYEYWDDYYAHAEAEEAARKQDEIERKRRGEEPDQDMAKAEATAKAIFGEEKEKPESAVKYTRKYFLEPDEAKSLKSVLRCSETIKEIMMWSKEKVREVIRETIAAKSNPPIDYTKALVFIGGNLDEAFEMAADIEDCDTNADVYRDHTLKIGTIEIKQALARRFKPEQIARLGSNHVIYPSLGTKAYLAIIKRSCHQYLDEAHKICPVRFSIAEPVYQEIYDNSVYPTQGTRPVFTSVHKMFGYPISDAILWALGAGIKDVDISLDATESAMVFTGQSDGRAHEKRVKIDLEMRARRAKHSDDFNALVAVHEAGHALVYADLFKAPPVEVAISIASFKGGYNRFKTEHLSKQETLDRIAVGMAGIVAEELMFGQELRSTGCGSDIRKTTSLAAQYVRAYGMDGFLSHVTQEMPGDVSANTDVRAANASIEQILVEQKARAQSILTKNRELLVDLSKHLLKTKKMNAADFVTYLDGRIEGLKPLTDKDVNGDYAARLEKA